MGRSNDAIASIFRDLDLADDDHYNLFETLDADGGGTIDMEELFSGVAKLRGEAKKSDIIAINLLVQRVQEDVATLLRSLRSSKMKRELSQRSSFQLGST